MEPINDYNPYLCLVNMIAPDRLHTAGRELSVSQEALEKTGNLW